jgi:ABC-2 type transport system ATP-binding protein
VKGTGLLTGGGALASGGHGLHLLSGGGHHGVRIVVLVLLVAAAAVVAVVLTRRARARRLRKGRPVIPPAPGTAADAPAPALAGSLSPAGTRRDGGTIAARGLTKHYGEKIAVDDLSFEVQPGRVTGFLGPNGAGKSTTMRMIMGLDAPDRGSVTVYGRPYHSLGWPLREVGALLEARSVHPGRSAYAHLWMLARTSNIPKTRVEEVLEIVGLTSVAHQRAGQFSLGMAQRLGIAGALLGDPGVLLLDEPVNGLDTDGIRWVRQLLRGLAAEGRTVFVSSHLMAELAQTVDHVVVIGRGRLIAEMPIAEFTSRNARGYVRLRSPQLDQLRPALEEAGAFLTAEPDGSLLVRDLPAEKIGELAWQKSVLLYELAPQSASLEEAFIESTEGNLEFHGARPSNHTGVSQA